MTDQTHDIYDKYDKYIMRLLLNFVLSDRNPDHKHCDRARNVEKYCHTAMSVSIYDTVRSAFKKNDRLCLEKTQIHLTKQIEASKKVSVDELLSALNNPNVSLARNIGAESYVPKYVFDEKKICTALR